MTSKDNAGALEKLDPRPVWAAFSRIAAIPRPSKKEGRIRQAVRAMAEERGLKVREDGVGNMVIDAPASAGCEGAPITVLQGHLDMVCEKNSDSTHDFERDPIRLIVDSDEASGKQIVRADGTTLGADNGLGLAMALAAASESGVTHGPLELLFTIDEETGMTGANALTPASFRGRRLLNLDSEEDNALYIGCAGGCDSTLSLELSTESPGAGDVCRVVVSGLRGGHSGGDIHENRGNAIKLLVRTLLRAGSDSLRLASIRGGQLRNAIPREAQAVIHGSPGTIKALQAAAKTVAREAVVESTEQRVSIEVTPVPAGEAANVVSTTDTARLLGVIAALPHGVMGMHRKIQGLVETSNNVATIAGTSAAGRSQLRIDIGNLSRSSSASRQREALDQIEAVGRLAGASVKTGSAYPGWEPDMDSPTLAICRRVYKQVFGEEPNVTAIHAGLECGIIGKQVGGVDMVSFGPKIEGAHSPDERTYVASVQKSWKYLCAVLAELARG